MTWSSRRWCAPLVVGVLVLLVLAAIAPAAGASGVLTPVACNPATVCATGSHPDGVTVDPSGSHVYVANSTTFGIVSPFAIGAGGVLAPIACNPASNCQAGNAPSGVAVDPSGTHLYVTNFDSDSVSVFAIGAGGALSPVACDPATICMTGSDPDTTENASGVVVDPSGTHLYVTNVSANSVSVFAIGAGGVLSPVACDPATICKTGSGPTEVAVDKSGTHLYVANVKSDSVSVFSIGAGGVLSPVACDAATVCKTGSSPRDVAVDKSGTHLYVTNVSSNSVSVFAIGAGGVLAPVACDPATSCHTGTTPQKLAIDPSGSRLYVTNRASGSVSVFAIGAGGVLAPVACTPVSNCQAGDAPLGVAVDPSGRHLYVTNSTSAGGMSVFAIGAVGGLAPVAVGRETISPTGFPAAPSGPSARAARKRTYGGKVTYTLNMAASVRFTVQRRGDGRTVRHGKRTTCDPTTRRNRNRKRCTRYVTLKGSFTRTGRSGINRFRFTGRLNAKRLPPGTYRLVATPTANARTGRAAAAGFRIIR